MTDMEMRFTLVRDALNRGFAVEDAMHMASEAVHFVLYGEPKKHDCPDCHIPLPGGEYIAVTEGMRVTGGAHG